MSPLHIGPPRELVVREERVRVGARARLLYASDLHLGLPWTRRAAVLLAEVTASAQPDAVLLGGDLLQRGAGLADLEALVRKLGEYAPVAAVPGNHDVAVGRERVRAAVVDGGGHWLPDAPLAVADVQIAGRVSSGSGAHVLCAHDPAVWPHARAAGHTLTLAGHLHGCQVRLATRRGREYPGAWFYRWNGPRFESDGATLLVSRGAADGLPVRWDCPHDVLLAECV